MRALSRGLAVLRHLNEHGASPVLAIASAVGVSRPAVYRMLDELCRLGYVRRRDANDGFEITHLVRRLSDGFSEEAWIRQIAAPILRDLQKQIVWPTDLATLFDNAMYLRETTRAYSPLTIDRAAVGLRLPLLWSATGRAYLAYCSEDERSRLIAALATSPEPLDQKARDTRWVNNLIKTVRANGYGQRFREIMPDTGAIALPVKHGPNILACLNVTFIASAVTPEQVAKRHLAAMREAACRIEDAVEAQFGSDRGGISKRKLHTRRSRSAKVGGDGS